MVDIDDNPGETTPLVATTNSNNDDDATAPALKDMKEQTLKEKVVGVGAVIGRECTTTTNNRRKSSVNMLIVNFA